MRIFHLVPNLNYGGLQKVVQMLALHQVKAGHSVTIGSWSNESNHPEAVLELEQAGIRLVYPRRSPDGGLTQSKKYKLAKLKSYLGPGNADILHVHNPFEYFMYGALAARLAGKTKTLNTIHLTAMFEHPRAGRRRCVHFLVGALLSHGVISCCAEVDTYLRKRFVLPGVKMFVVDNGIELDSFLAVADRTPREQVIFGFAGRMAPEKNYPVLIDAFALAHRKYSNIRLRILGGGPLEPALKEQVHKLGLDAVVEFCGFSNNVPAFLATLDVYVLPSKYEALPLSLLEAIASGLPVVATAVGGVPSIVEKTESGWLCGPNSPEALSAAMELAIASPRSNDRTRRARQLTTQFYSADRMAADHEAVYKSVL